MMSGNEISLNLKRFGIWPPKRLFTQSRLEPVLVNSIPKSGTHLVETILCETGPFYRPFHPTFNPRLHKTEQLGRAIANLKRGQILFAHFPYSEDLLRLILARECKLVFVARDPRDVVISNAHFIPTLPKHVHFKALSGLAFEERLEILISGSVELEVPSIFEKTEPFVDWMEHADHIVHFENLSRNADLSMKQQETGNLLKALGADAHQVEVEIKAASTTFRKGVSGDWVNVLSPRQQQKFTDSEMLRKLGYH